MSPIPCIESVSGRLLLTAEPAALTPLVVHQNTLLGQLSDVATTHSHIFARDDSGRIVGLVSSEWIRERLNVVNEGERNRWAGTPISYLCTLTFPTDTINPGAAHPSTAPCAALFENGTLLSIVGQDDVFISWRRLSAAVSHSTSDPLTGLMNRLAYERRLYEEWDRARRSGFSIGIIIIDLDHFKSINDRFGHDAGDKVLCLVASTLEASLRSYDVLVRYGGDEFVALCVGCRPGEIRIPVARILDGLRNCGNAGIPGGMRISASIGAAVRHFGFQLAEPPGLFCAADECVYLAKTTRDSAYWIEYCEDSVPRPMTFDNVIQQGDSAIETCPTPELMSC